MENETKTKLGKFHYFWLTFDIGLLTSLFLFPMIIIEKFYKIEKRGRFWRKMAMKIISASMRWNGVEVIVNHPENIVKDQPVIYASNHPSFFDGFMLITILGPDLVLVTAPLQQFPKILATWLRKMETVHVRRDPVDDKRYPGGESKPHAIRHAIRNLKNGNSILIFPEGHIELLHLLHYFHTGVARIAIGSHTPIVPISICNADKVFPTEHSAFPGPVTINFGKMMNPPTRKSATKMIFSKAKVLRLRDEIEQAIVQMLPARYEPDYFKEPKTKRIGVFVDIDRTIYEGLSQKDLVGYLFSLHKLHYSEAFKIFYWLYLEKLNKIKHTDLMKKSLMILRGWDIAELKNVVHTSFKNKLIGNMQYGMLPILKDHAEQNHSIVFISEVIHPLAQEFKKFFRGRTTLDTKLETHNHCYTGQVNCLCYKDVKAKLLEEFSHKHHIDLQKSYAYADSGSDIPFLKLVKHPYAINPDEKLLKFALKKKLEIMEDAN